MFNCNEFLHLLRVTHCIIIFKNTPYHNIFPFSTCVHIVNLWRSLNFKSCFDYKCDLLITGKVSFEWYKWITLSVVFLCKIKRTYYLGLSIILSNISWTLRLKNMTLKIDSILFFIWIFLFTQKWCSFLQLRLSFKISQHAS